MPSAILRGVFILLATRGAYEYTRVVSVPIYCVALLPIIIVAANCGATGQPIRCGF